MNWEVWGAPIAVLSAGIVAGLFLALRSQGTSRRDRAAEAMAVKDSLVDQMRALRADEAKLSQQEFQLKWSHLLDAAATALRDAERLQGEPEPETVATPETPNTTSWGRRLTWAVVILGFFTGLGAILQTSLYERTEGSTMTGGQQVSGSPMSEIIAELQETAKAEPTNIDPVNRLAHLAIQQGDLGKAMSWMDAARALEPDHPEVRTHLAILQLSVGMTERAKAELETALAADANFSEALLWKGIIALRADDRDTAIAALESALETAADRESRMMATQALAEARKPPATVQLRGNLKLSEGTIPAKGGVLFVMVRRAAEAAGPPVAAVRLDPRGLPGTFVVTDRDVMMGGPWPDQVWVEARLDADGDPSTKGSADLTTARLGPFSSGSEGIELVLSGETKAATPESAGGARVSGELKLAAGTAPPTQGSVFVIVRRTPTPQGPPVAALKLGVSSVPGAFSADDSDIMMGGPWPDQVWLQARADQDGNAMTKSDGDLSSSIVGPISAGSTGITLTLAAP